MENAIVVGKITQLSTKIQNYSLFDHLYEKMHLQLIKIKKKKKINYS